MSIEIPAERVPPIAKEVAYNRKCYVACWVGGVAVAITLMFVPTPHNPDGNVVGGVVWAIICAAFGFRQLRLAGRATKAARLAGEGRTSFMLTGKLLIAVDERQVSQPDASFKINKKQETMLFPQIPKAEVRP